FQKAEKEKEEKMQRERGEFKQARWGNQLRSYIFQPYQLVKDHRTNVKNSNLKKVLDGDLDKFIKAEINANI
ncbi:MAG: peptide chain release factor 2, partial [Patescibacteria group bacterium]